MAPTHLPQGVGHQLPQGRVLGQPTRSPSLSVSHSRGRSTVRRAAHNVANPQRVSSSGEQKRRELSPPPAGVGTSAPRSSSPTRPAGTDSRNVSAAATSSVQAQVTDRIAGVWTAYTDRLESDPIRTKALTSFMGFVIGDTLAQRIGGDPIDPFRCLRLGAYGLFLDGPIGHLWYKVLDKNVMPDNPRSNTAVLIKTAADQLVWAPLMTVVFFAVLKTLEGHPELIWATVQDKLVKTVVANYILWPGAHWINFKYVPTQHRILYNNCVSIVWNAFLSTLSHAPEIDTDQVMGLVSNTQQQALDVLPPALRAQLQPLNIPPIERLLPEGIGLPKMPSNVVLPPFERLLPEGTSWTDLQAQWRIPRKIVLAPTRAIHPAWMQWMSFLPWFD